MTDRPLLAASLLAILSLPAFGAETRTAPAGAPRPSASIEELRWLAGSWLGEGLTGPARESYSPPMGNAIVGHFVQQRGEGTWFYEIMLIRPDGDSLSYCLKHFNADLTGWEEKDQVRCFPLVAREAGAWYFDGLTIRREGEHGMVAAVLVKTRQEAKEIVIRYRRE